MALQMPGYLDYGNMMQMNPQAYGQAQAQVGLAQQFQAEQQKQEELKTLADQMKNEQSSAMNPLLVEQQTLANQFQTDTNSIQGVKARITSQTEPEAKAAAKAKFLQEADESTLAQVMAQGKALSLHPDPAKKAKGDQMLQDTWEEQSRRAKAKDALEQAKVAGSIRLDGIDRQQQGADSRTQAIIEGQNQRAAAAAKAKGEARMNPKENFQQAISRYYGEAQKATTPEGRQAALDAISDLQNMNLAERTAQSGTKPDLNALGVQTNPVVTGVPTGMRAPLGSGAQVAPATQANRDQEALQVLQNELTKAVTSGDTQTAAGIQREMERLSNPGKRVPIPAQQAAPKAAPTSFPTGAVDMLKKNPGLASAFDAKYGAGASKKALGQ